MDNSRMSNADMIQYCDEALAWEEFGPVDIFFFESVKRILLGECSPIEEPDDVIDDLMGIERPVTDDELAPDYDKYADDYYDGEEVLCQLEGLSLEPKVRLRLEDLFYDYYGRWSADAFALGLHLGLSLFHGHVCRGRAQQADEVAGG